MDHLRDIKKFKQLGDNFSGPAHMLILAVGEGLCYLVQYSSWNAQLLPSKTFMGVKRFFRRRVSNR